MAEPNLIKVCLTNKGEDTETPWAADLGPVGNDGSRKVKLVNVPFMHAKPTWGDTIIVKPPRKSEGPPTWDREGVPWKQIASKIVEDGGRWAMIVDYAPSTTADEAFAALGKTCDEAKIVCEGAWAPRERDPGRVYLAVQKELTAEQVMGILVGASLPMELTQIHPEPKKRVRAQTEVGISADAGRPPASKKPSKSETSGAMKSGASKPAKAEASAASKPAKSETSTATKSAASKPAKSETSTATKSAASKPTKSETSAASKPTKSESSTASKPAAKPDTSAATKAAKPAAKPDASAATKAAKPAANAAAASKATVGKSATKAAPAPAKAAPKPAKAPAKPAPKPPAKKADAKKLKKK